MARTAATENEQDADGAKEPGRLHRATSYDVARLAGVSQSAVSRAFRDGGSISRETRAKVEQAARQLHYAPSLLARSLITQRTHLVGVVMTELTARNYPDLLRILGLEIQAAGSRMLLCSVPDDAGAADGAADLLGFQVDGIISSASLSSATLEACERQGVPVVLYNRTAVAKHVSAVACDHRDAMEALVAHLVEGGLERALFIAGPETAPVSADRLRGLSAAFGARALRPPAVVHGDYSYEAGRRIARERLAAAAGRPDTVIAANDATALGVLDGLRFDLGLRAPDDVAVAGFDDVAQAAWPAYDLTTLRQPVQRLTHLSVAILHETIAGAFSAGARRLLPAELKIRGSTRRG